MVMNSEKSTTIQISVETREELKALGSKGETYDEIVKKLLRIAKECEKK